MNKAYIIMGLPKNDREQFLENFLKTNKGENCLVVSRFCAFCFSPDQKRCHSCRR